MLTCGVPLGLPLAFSGGGEWENFLRLQAVPFRNFKG